MDFGQYDYLGERIFSEQQSQPGGSSSAQQFGHRLPPFAPQYRPGLQLFASGPQMFAGQFVGSQFAGPFSGPLPFTYTFMGQIPPLVWELSLGLTSVRRQFQDRRRHFL
jgi:hypothetical protein